MKRIIIIALALIAGLSLVGSAQASSIRECGRLPYLINGYQDVENVTSRHMSSCSATRATAWSIEKQVLRRDYGSNNDKIHLRSHWFGWAGWSIHAHWYREPGMPGYFISQDVRATASGGRVVYYQVVGE